MNREFQRNEVTASRATPLFASSWVALYELLRDNLARSGHVNASGSPKAGPMAR